MLDECRCGTLARRSGQELVTIDVLAGDGDEQVAAADGTGVLGQATDRDIGQAGRPDRPTVEPGAADLAALGEPVDQARERHGGGGLGCPEQLGQRRVGHRRRTLASRPDHRPRA